MDDASVRELRQLFQSLVKDCSVLNGESLESLINSSDKIEILKQICSFVTESNENEVETGRTLLHCCACNRNHPDPIYHLARRLIEFMPELVTKTDSKGMSCLHLCASNDGPLGEQWIDLLLQNGADINLSELEHGYTVLHMAVLERNVNILTVLLKTEEAFSKPDKKGATPLHYAVQLCTNEHEDNKGLQLVQQIADAVSHEEKAKMLMQQDHSGKTPLHWAVCENSEGAIRTLLSQLEKNSVASILSVQDNMGLSPLMMAVERGFTGIVNLLLNEYNQDPDMAVDKRSRNALHLAASAGHTEICEMLLQYFTPQQINAEDDNKRTPLHYAAANNHKRIVQVLLSQGGAESITVGNGVNELPIHEAAAEGHLEIVELLLEDENAKEYREVTINALSNTKRSPLHSAVIHGHHDIVRLLITNGANVNQVGYSEAANQPFTALDVSESWPECRQILMETGAMTYNAWEKIASNASRPTTGKSQSRASQDFEKSSPAKDLPFFASPNIANNSSGDSTNEATNIARSVSLGSPQIRSSVQSLDRPDNLLEQVTSGDDTEIKPVEDNSSLPEAQTEEVNRVNSPIDTNDEWKEETSGKHSSDNVADEKIFDDEPEKIPVDDNPHFTEGNAAEDNLLNSPEDQRSEKLEDISFDTGGRPESRHNSYHSVSPHDIQVSRHESRRSTVTPSPRDNLSPSNIETAVDTWREHRTASIVKSASLVSSFSDQDHYRSRSHSSSVSRLSDSSIDDRNLAGKSGQPFTSKKSPRRSKVSAHPKTLSSRKPLAAVTSQRIIREVQDSVAQYEYIRLIGRAAHYKVRQQTVKQVALTQSGDNFHRVYHQLLQASTSTPRTHRSRKSPTNSARQRGRSGHRNSEKNIIGREATNDGIPSSSSPKSSKRLLPRRPETATGNSLYQSSPYAQPQVMVRKIA